MDFLTEFWTEKYLMEYIHEGGSKIKFVTGKKGSGKTYFVKNFLDIAKDLDYKTVYFSANDIWLHDFKEIYLEIFRQCDIHSVLNGCAKQIIQKMGYSYSEIKDGQTFMDYLAAQGIGDALTRREIRLQLKSMFLDNPNLDNNFALACSLITGGILGHPILESQNEELLLLWLKGDKEVKLPLLKSLGLSPEKINKYNARNMLRSLAEVIHLGGYTGLVVAIDDMEVMLSKSSLAPVHYTNIRRQDAYESIRQLIDDLDSLHHVMFLLAFRRELMDDEDRGIKSYQALWMRIQNEIVSTKFNCFADIVNMDDMLAQAYSASDWIALSKEMIENYSNQDTQAITLETANEVMEKAKRSGVGIPLLLQEKIFGGHNHD